MSLVLTHTLRHATRLQPSLHAQNVKPYDLRLFQMFFFFIYFCVCVCVVAGCCRSRTNIPPVFCNITQPYGYRMCFFSQHIVFTYSLFFSSHFPFPFFVPFLFFFLLRFDIYRKVPKDLTQPTYTGAFSEWSFTHEKPKLFYYFWLYIFLSWIFY